MKLTIKEKIEKFYDQIGLYLAGTLFPNSERGKEYNMRKERYESLFGKRFEIRNCPHRHLIKEGYGMGSEGLTHIVDLDEIMNK